MKEGEASLSHPIIFISGGGGARPTQGTSTVFIDPVHGSVPLRDDVRVKGGGGLWYEAKPGELKKKKKEAKRINP